MSQDTDTMVQCTECQRVYAAYYTGEDHLITPGGEHCPNCHSDQFLDVSVGDR